LKPVVDDDARQIFEWRNDPFVIEKSTLKKAVTWNEHQAWFAAALKDGTKKIYLVFNGEEKIGSVRFDRSIRMTASFPLMS
jgi:RimJ/RimL family protein N-acetyltransferase